jgi:CRISPR/Cas system endoribonuclease Cas6 (RAMP superfamily)
LPLAATVPARRVRVHFLSPTELKNARRPEFGPLFSRIRDRIGTLRALYGSGPLEIDFKAMGERAMAIQMTRCDIRHVEVERSTGQRHPLGGFTGIAEYEGDLTEFIPYLEIAGYTGVGRQTVWGNGEISIETF